MKLILQSIFAIACLLMVDLSFADEFDTKREACRKDSSKTWDDNLNRCMTTKRSKKGLEEYRNCTLYEKKEDRDRCMFNLVKKVSGDAELEDTNWDSLLIDTISTGISISNLNFVGEGEMSPCLSLKMGATCGGLAILKTLYIMYEAKKETKDNLKEFEDKAADKENYDAQVLAYDSQIKQLKSLSKFYDKKQKLNKLIAACYTATAAYAAYEAVGASIPSCVTGAGQADQADQANQANQADQAADTQDPVQESSSDTADTAAAPEKVYEQTQLQTLVSKIPALGAYVKKFGGSMMEFLATPAGVATLALTNAGWNLIKANKLQEQGEKADLLAKRSEVARDQFVTSMEKYCPNGHEDKNNLMCYCYENGEKKANRTNSDSCKALWAKNERNLFAASSDKTRKSGSDTTKVGCLTLNGKFDPSCQCRKFKDTQGNNACKKTNFSTVQLAGLGQVMDVKQLETDLNNISSGLTSATGFDMTPEQTQALGGKVRDQILRQIPFEDKKGVRPGTPEDLAAVQKNLLSGITRQLAANPVSADNFDRELNKIQEEMSEKFSEKSAQSEVKKLKLTGGKGAAKKNNKKQNFALNLGGSSSNVEQYPEYMNKKYKTKNADVVTNKDVSIFQVLSNRYYKSGFKRLFDE
ncbi:hypothetical protein BIY24_08005 [Halobacteriovorax marinus]|uniref:hypothetical protein n=1 Tax=Halobacteriovorax marinus TaxID=97084 RepID=UPI000BC34CC2|nr:hypothetical protein [Halobacteriovorax marinus]ATH07893.1 hypothetical protein BIY24_08005 [Halobacteriovorax marinus]